MSRCFPFPPPGYEETASLGPVRSDPLREEKRKEKKHKKEKRDKEKGEVRERKDKNRDKDKHKDKKDRKEKHKKRDKDRDKDRRGKPEEWSGKDAGLHNRATPAESTSHKYHENNDSVFKEELAKRFCIEEKSAAKQSVESIPLSFNKTPIRIGAASSGPNVISVSKMVPLSRCTVEQHTVLESQSYNSANGTVQRRNEGPRQEAKASKEKGNANLPPHPDSMITGRRGHGSLGEPLTSSYQKYNATVSSISIKNGRENSATEQALHNGKQREDQLVTNSYSISVKRENGRVEESFSMSPLPGKRSVDPSSATAAQVDSETQNKAAAKPSVPLRTTNGLVLPSKRFSITVQKKVEPDYNLSAVVGLEMPEAKKVLPGSASLEQSRMMSNSRPRSYKDALEGADVFEKANVGGLREEKLELVDYDANNQKEKRKDNGKYKESKNESRSTTGDCKHKHSQRSVDGAKDQNHFSGSQPPALLPDVRGSAAADFKKRKGHEMNGYLQNHDVRPAKSSRTILSDVHVENGRTGPLSHASSPFPSPKPGVVDFVKAEQLLDRKKLDGFQDYHNQPGDPNSAVPHGKSSGIPAKPHPDSRYLSQVYGVPKMEKLPEFDDQDWLFAGDSFQQKRNREHDVESSFQVWADALQIESADVIALPYVIPF